ncbi:hypothetical protein BJ741DRAFT_654831 [Chytriomyces cf. hyalinus JEL632]|nr:hypothetical protein BJ741DRAFT_654831 [Chytriomyces cf. hyalinus JEL632]
MDTLPPGTNPRMLLAEAQNAIANQKLPGAIELLSVLVNMGASKDPSEFNPALAVLSRASWCKRMNALVSLIIIKNNGIIRCSAASNSTKATGDAKTANKGDLNHAKMMMGTMMDLRHNSWTFFSQKLKEIDFAAWDDEIAPILSNKENLDFERRVRSLLSPDSKKDVASQSLSSTAMATTKKTTTVLDFLGLWNTHHARRDGHAVKCSNWMGRFVNGTHGASVVMYSV